MKFAKHTCVLLLFLTAAIAFAQKETDSQKKLIRNYINLSGKGILNLDVIQSLHNAKLALDESHKIADNELMARSYNLIGLNFEEFYDVDRALKYYEKGLELANKTNNDSIKCWINNNIGNSYSYRKGDVKKALPYYLKGLAYAKKINDPYEIMFSNLNIAGAYIGVDDAENSSLYLKKAKPLVDQSTDPEAKISYATISGLILEHYKRYPEAEASYMEAIHNGKSVEGQLYESYLIDVYHNLSGLYTKTGKLDKALEYLNKYSESQDKLYSEDRRNNAKIAGSTIEFSEYERKINEIEEEKDLQFENLRKSKTLVWLFFITLLILGFFTYNYYKNYRIKSKLTRQLLETNEELRLAKEKAEEASQLKTQFVSTISHELRTPLYGVVGITNIIMDEHRELEKSPHLNSLKFSARYLLSLVNDLLQINKIEENRVVLENMIFNLPDEVNTIADSLEFIALKNNNKIVTEIDTDIPEFLIGDKLRLSQIVLNLMSNALKFTKDGEVKIILQLDKVEGTRHFVHFKVSDNGVGIAPEDQQKIFDKFVQIERKEGDYQGTGLGLAIVKKLLEVFDSSIHLESELGVGTTFSFTIAFEADDEKRNEIINNIEVDLSSGQIFRILVVEDNKINQVVTRKFLENNNFYCKVVDDGYAAIDMLETDYFDLVLMDINMPVINGFETTKLIRKRGITLPIVALTAFDKQEISEQAISSGMNDIIIKPFEPSRLFKIISSSIKRENVV